MLSRRLGLLFLPACLCMALSLILLGCGSASSSDYNDEVSAIYRKTSEELQHIFEELNHGESEEGEGEEEVLLTSLEEAAEVVHHAYQEMEKVKVPEGLEDLHKESLALLQSVALSYEEQAALLAPEGLQQEESHDEEDHEQEENSEAEEEHTTETEGEHEDGGEQGH